MGHTISSIADFTCEGAVFSPVDVLCADLQRGSGCFSNHGAQRRERGADNDFGRFRILAAATTALRLQILDQRNAFGSCVVHLPIASNHVSS